VQLKVDLIAILVILLMAYNCHIIIKALTNWIGEVERSNVGRKVIRIDKRIEG